MTEGIEMRGKLTCFVFEKGVWGSSIYPFLLIYSVNLVELREELRRMAAANGGKIPTLRLSIATDPSLVCIAECCLRLVEPPIAQHLLNMDARRVREGPVSAYLRHHTSYEKNRNANEICSTPKNPLVSVQYC